MLPLNRFYLGNIKGVLLRYITINYFLLSWVGDLVYMDKTFDEARLGVDLLMRIYATSRLNKCSLVISAL